MQSSANAPGRPCECLTKSTQKQMQCSPMQKDRSLSTQSLGWCVTLIMSDCITSRPWPHHISESDQSASRAHAGVRWILKVYGPPEYFLMTLAFMSHSLSWLSRVPVSRYLPLGENLTKETGGFCWSVMVFRQAPSSVFQIRHRPS